MVYQLKIQLQGVTKPPVWRRIFIPSYASFEDLHYVIQAAFGWENEHLYAFSKKPYDGGWKIEGDDIKSDLDFLMDPDTRFKAKNVCIAEFLNQYCPKITYTYDFGDDWFHQITLEAIVPDSPAQRASCMDAKGCCPPENCGGVYGYKNLKDIISANPEKAIIASREDYDDWDDEDDQEEGQENKADEFPGIDFVRWAGPFFEVVKGKPDFAKVDLNRIDLHVRSVRINGVEKKRGRKPSKAKKNDDFRDESDEAFLQRKFIEFWNAFDQMTRELEDENYEGELREDWGDEDDDDSKD